ncbi:hypothetical protein ETU09_05925 [Apibacter muscae]|uniref:Uncharacterized protein n=1 Tax=Apibacter muscae TaxID=2509004 RepID=A0A563DES3_9FLAO|nr:hypothetical protein [Apibacter muscae]TWP28461.1 hypothetical protein ETU09_05925 [Apibacter muscae]
MSARKNITQAELKISSALKMLESSMIIIEQEKIKLNHALTILKEANDGVGVVQKPRKEKIKPLSSIKEAEVRNSFF